MATAKNSQKHGSLCQGSCQKDKGTSSKYFRGEKVILINTVSSTFSTPWYMLRHNLVGHQPSPAEPPSRWNCSVFTSQRSLVHLGWQLLPGMDTVRFFLLESTKSVVHKVQSRAPWGFLRPFQCVQPVKITFIIIPKCSFPFSLLFFHELAV